MVWGTKRSVAVLLLLLLGGSVTYSQGSLNSDAFFNRTINALQAASHLADKNIHFPWIEELSLRTETRDFDFDQQEYTLRISPSTPKIRKAQADLLNHYNTKPDVTQLEQKTEQIARLYTDWLMFYFITEELGILNDLEAVWEDKELVQQRLIGSYQFDFKELIDLRAEKLDLNHARFELDYELTNRLELYQLEAVQLDFQDLINLTEIEEKVASDLLVQTGVLRTEAIESAYEVSEIEKEIALEEAEKRQLFDFFQVRYRGPHEDLYRERIAVGLGLQFPNSGNRKLKLAELQKEAEEIQNERLIENQEYLVKREEIKKELLFKIRLAQNYQGLTAREATELENLNVLIQKKEGFNPLTAIQIKENKLAAQLKSLEYQEDVYFEYLKYLIVAGQLSASPFLNYLKL